jgi:hypothetical protein
VPTDNCTASIRAGQAATAGKGTWNGGPKGLRAAAAATASDDQRRVPGTDDKASATASRRTGHAGAAHGDFQNLAGSEAEDATDLGTQPTSGTCARDVSTLSAKGEDLIVVSGRHREGDEAPGISEVEWHGAAADPDATSPRHAVPASRTSFILSSPLKQRADPVYHRLRTLTPQFSCQ